MTRAVLLSLKPRFAEAILDGSKTLELRRRFPILPKGTVFFLYATSPLRSLVGTATLVQTTPLPPHKINSPLLAKLRLEHAEALDYLKGTNVGTLLELQQPERFWRPIELDSMRKQLGLEPMQSYRYLEDATSNALKALGKQ